MCWDGACFSPGYFTSALGCTIRGITDTLGIDYLKVCTFWQRERELAGDFRELVS